MNFYFYSIKFEGGEEYGYTVGENYSAAMDNLTSYYGENDTIKVTLEYITDNPILVLPDIEGINTKGLLAAIKENNNF